MYGYDHGGCCACHACGEPTQRLSVGSIILVMAASLFASPVVVANAWLLALVWWCLVLPSHSWLSLPDPPCSPGHYKGSSCSPCPAGRYQSTSSSLSYCPGVCHRGYFCFIGAITAYQFICGGS